MIHYFVLISILIPCEIGSPLLSMYSLLCAHSNLLVCSSVCKLEWELKVAVVVRHRGGKEAFAECWISAIK